MYSKLGWVIAIVMAIFPYAVVVAKLGQTESIVTTLVVTAIVVVFFLTVLIASRITIEPEPATGAAKEPAPPVAWSWDGVNRQPDADEASKQDEGIKM